MDLQSFIIVKDYSEMVTVTAYFGGFNQVSQNMNFRIKDGLLFICGPKLQYLFCLSSVLSLTLHVRLTIGVQNFIYPKKKKLEIILFGVNLDREC